MPLPDILLAAPPARGQGAIDPMSIGTDLLLS